MPLGVVVDGANRHDMKLLGPTLSEPAAPRPEPDAKNPQHLCLDKGYDYPIIREQVAELGLCPSFAFARRRERRKSGDSRIPGQTMGGRTDPLLDESLSPLAHSLGKESGELRGHAPFCLRLDLFPLRRGFRIGTKFDVSYIIN
jgi:hypothetical protein